MNVLVELNNNRIYITSERSDQERCKLIPGVRWDRTAQQWHVAKSWAACKQLRAVFGFRLEIGPNLMDWAQQEVSQRIAPSLALRDALYTKDIETVLNDYFIPRDGMLSHLESVQKFLGFLDSEF